MKLKIEKSLQILFHVFGISHSKFAKNFIGKLISFVVLIVHIFILSVSILFVFQKINEKHFQEFFKSYTKFCIFSVVSLTAFYGLIQSWKGKNLEREIERNLEEIDEILNERWKGKTLKSKTNWLKMSLKYLCKFVFTILPVIVCISLSFIPFFLDKTVGLWEILLYSVLLIKIASFYYALLVGKVQKRLVRINKKIEKLVEGNEKFELYLKRILIVVENPNAEREILVEVNKFIDSYSLLFTTVKIFNKRFGVSVFLIIFSIFLSVTYCGYNFFIESETTRDPVVITGE